MPSVLRSRRPVALGLVAMAFLASGCVQQDRPGVQIQQVAASLVFGAKPRAASAPAPNFMGALAPLAPLGAIPSFTFPDTSIPDDYLGPPLAPKLACPPAGLNSFPKQAAAANVPAGLRPAVGAYRWVRSGSVKGPETGNIAIPIGGFERRVIQNVVSTSATAFTFEMVQPELVSTDVVTTTFLVNTAQGSVQAPPASPAPPVSAGGPERGIVVKKIVRTDAKGVVLSTFAPPTGLLELPLPARVTEQVTSAAVDPVSLGASEFQAAVLPAARLNACGEVIEAWPVSGTQRSVDSSGKQRERTYTAYFAPHLGGLLVGEHIEETSSTGSTLKVDLTIGQLTATPLTAGAR